MGNSSHYIGDITQVFSLQDALGKNPEVISFDVESSGLRPKHDRLLMVQLKIGNDRFVLDCTSLDTKELTYMAELIQTSSALLIGHNVKFDVKFIKEKTGILFDNVYCTQVAEAMITGGQKRYETLARLAMKYLGVYLDKDVRETFIDHEGPLTTEQIKYGIDDVEYLEDIYRLQLEIIQKEKMEKVLSLESRLIPAVAMMELAGVMVDRNGWEELNAENEKQFIIVTEKFKKTIWDKVLTTDFTEHTLLELFDYLDIPVRTKRDRTAFSEAGVLDCEGIFYEWYNPGSWKQILGAFRLFGIPLESTGDAVITNYIKYDTNDHEHISLIENLLEVREVGKKVSTYGTKFLEGIDETTGKIYANFNQIGARTGRFSSSNPNMQNIPRTAVYRSKFIPSKGYSFVCADYSQQEYRLAGEVSGETAIINAYISGVDMHTLTGELLKDLGMTRDEGKTTNFAVLYGSTVYGLAHNLKIPVRTAEHIIDIIMGNYPALMAFINTVGDKVLERYYSVTPLGRRRYFERKDSYDSPEAYTKYLAMLRREGFNHVIQGGSADMMKFGIINIFYDNPFGFDKLRTVITVHDEVVVEVHNSILEEGVKFVEDCLIKAGQVFHSKIPVKADAKITECWSK